MASRRTMVRFVGGVSLLALTAGGVMRWRWQTDQDGRERLAAVVARLDATDPRWRSDDLQADRPAIPDEQNAARRVAQFRQAAATNPYVLQTLAANDYPFGGTLDQIDVAPNRVPDAEDDRRLDVALAGTEPGWPAIRRLSECPRGRMRAVLVANWSGWKPLAEERPEVVKNYLHWESERLARGHHPDRQEVVLRALLNLARIEGPRPSHGFARTRLIDLTQAARRVERLLALDRLGPGLDHIQAELAREAEADLVRPAMRDLRANRHELFRRVEAGEFSLADYMGQGVEGRVLLWVYRPHFYADWALSLDVATQFLAVADLPEPAQLAATAAIPMPDDAYRFAGGCHRSGEAHLRVALSTKALLRCTIVALAAERHRLATGAWPESLAALPGAVLATVPPDPYTGEPLHLAHRDDGVTVYSVGPDGRDDGGAVQPGQGWDGTDIGFRLFNPDQRHLPALPPEEAPAAARPGDIE